MHAGFEVSYETYPSTKTASLRVLVHFGRVIRSADDPPTRGSTDVYRHERAQALKIERYFWLDPKSPFVELRWTGSDTIEDWFGFHCDLQGISHDGLAFLEFARGFIGDPRKAKPVEIASAIGLTGMPLLRRQGLGPNKFSLESLVVDEDYRPEHAGRLVDVFTPFDLAAQNPVAAAS